MDSGRGMLPCTTPAEHGTHFVGSNQIENDPRHCCLPNLWEAVDARNSKSVRRCYSRWSSSDPSKPHRQAQSYAGPTTFFVGLRHSLPMPPPFCSLLTQINVQHDPSSLSCRVLVYIALPIPSLLAVLVRYSILHSKS